MGTTGKQLEFSAARVLVTVPRLRRNFQTFSQGISTQSCVGIWKDLTNSLVAKCISIQLKSEQASSQFVT